MKKNPVFTVVMCMALFTVSTFSQTPFTLEERVAGQEAIDRVFYELRKDHALTEGLRFVYPAFEDIVSEALIEGKVIDYARKSEALGEVFENPITVADMQNEVNRMSSDSLDPATLEALYSALGDDPDAIAEMLARPFLADRNIREAYAMAPSMHPVLKAEAETAFAQVLAAYEAEENDVMETYGGNNYQCQTLIRLHPNDPKFDEKLDNRVAPRGNSPCQGYYVTGEEYESQISGLPAPRLITFSETQQAFVIRRVAFQTPKKTKIETIRFEKESFDSWWDDVAGLFDGGLLGNPVPICCRNVGGRYDPASNKWGSMPIPYNKDENRDFKGRDSTTLIWAPELGSSGQAILWGGRPRQGGTVDPVTCVDNVGDITQTKPKNGAHFDPNTNSWATSISRFDTADIRPAAVWTGEEMVLWGGAVAACQQGARYHPTVTVPFCGSFCTAQTDPNMAETPITGNTPLIDSSYLSVWTGEEMLLFGWESGRFDPSLSCANQWKTPMTSVDIPTPRTFHTVIWTGQKMIVWGGKEFFAPGIYLNSGGHYNPDTDTWQPTSMFNAPVARGNIPSVWASNLNALVVWGHSVQMSDPLNPAPYFYVQPGCP